MAMLAAGLLCVTSFSACDDDEDDSERHLYEMIAELTDPGSMTPAEIQTSKEGLEIYVVSINQELSTIPQTSAKAKKTLKELVNNFRKMLDDSTLTKAVTYTFSMKNKSMGKIEHTETLTIQPRK